jgi:hypothetical protein
MIDKNGFLRKLSWPTRGFIPVFALSLRKTMIISVRMTGVVTKDGR